MENTNWSTPKTNFFSGIFDLRKALASGYKAKLIREWNENCQHPIKIKEVHNDFKCFEFNYGSLTTRTKIINDSNMTDFEKHLSLNYKNCYGTQDAVDTYYKTGYVSADNFRGVGRSHLVKVSDMIEFFEKNGDDRADMFKKQYITQETAEENHFYDFYKLSSKKSYWNTKKFKRKLWVVVLLKNYVEIKIPFIIKALNVILYPLMFIPQKSVLKLKDNKTVTFRIGSVSNGYSISIQIPKKFSF